ncbi:alpha/beta hydrolase [Escherichia coli]
MQSALDGKTIPHWYRMINRLMWIWRGIDPREILDVQARIVMSDAERTDDDLYDTVIGYRGGNWIYGKVGHPGDGVATKSLCGR